MWMKILIDTNKSSIHILVVKFFKLKSQKISFEKIPNNYHLITESCLFTVTDIPNILFLDRLSTIHLLSLFPALSLSI